jgi:hypothetical protein
MGQNLHIVFSHPGAGVTDEEFGRWYDEHLDEILSIPGFHSAQRYRLEPAVTDGEAVFPFRNLVVYEVDADTAALMAAMEEAQLNDADAYVDRKGVDASGPELPEWWDRVRFASFNAIAVGDKHGR